MTQLNTPYPATAYLTGFLRSRGHDAVQADPAIELVLRLLTRRGLEEIAAAITDPWSRSLQFFVEHLPRYLSTVGPVVRYLQGKDASLAWRLCADDYLPRGPRFDVLQQYALEDEGDDPLGWAFGNLGLRDRAQHLASLYVDDLADVIREGVDPRFEMSRYAEKLASSAPSFDPIAAALEAEPTLVDQYLDAISRELVERHDPDVVGITLPFPGNVYGGFRMAREVRRVKPGAALVMGGGYVNTELRGLSDARVFDSVDYVTLDDGEGPLLAILDRVAGKSDRLLRTMVRDNGKVVVRSHPELHDIPFRDTGAPTYDGLPVDRYLSVCELLNPMHRLWSDGRWNKLTLAHGCYWRKCTFCDITLDYIGRYEAVTAARIVDRMEALIAETGATGFHFVDEAAPPKVLGAMAEEILRRGLTVTWWGNIRFEKTFTPALTRLLADSGCIAVTGGLEVASDRLLALMEKGVTVEQVARVSHAFTEAGVMVHAYLMFGFPTQTIQETIDSLERVRQLFAQGCIQSAFWHRFAATVHSPIGKDPERFGVRLVPVPSTFAQNEVPFEDPTGVDHDALHPGLKKALYNYMHGIGLDEDVRRWFDFPVPKARVPRNLVAQALARP
jgi:radical SAM superfamily enzyme YgiQ (UPF0313 family)